MTHDEVKKAYHHILMDEYKDKMGDIDWETASHQLADIATMAQGFDDDDEDIQRLIRTDIELHLNPPKKTKTTKGKRKKICHITIWKITAKTVTAGAPPPGVFEFEAEAEVFYEDGTSERLYFSKADLDIPMGWQVFSKSVSEIEEEDICAFDKYRVAEYSTNSKAYASPYGDVLRKLTEIYKIAVKL